MPKPTYNQHRLINQVAQLLQAEGIEPEIVNWGDISAGAGMMLRGMGITGVLDITDTLDRTWPSKKDDTENPWLRRASH